MIETVQDYSISVIGWNNKESPEDMKRLNVTGNLVKTSVYLWCKKLIDRS